MRLRHIEVFNAIMLTGSVSGGARLLNLTQPAVSRTLKHAEIQLGFPLFRRDKGRLTATTEALALYPHVERVFSEINDVGRLAAQLRTGSEIHELRIVTTIALTYEVLPRALKGFREKNRSVSIHVESHHSPQIISALLLREADVGFAFSPRTHPSLIQEPLIDSPIVCAVPRGMLPKTAVRSGFITLAALAELPIVAQASSDPVIKGVNQACDQMGLSLQSVITVQTYHAALAMAHHGLGVALIEGCTALSADKEKVDVLTLDPSVSVPVRTLRLTHQPDSIAVRALVRHVREAISAAR